MEITAVIPTKNRPELLLNAVKSICSQDLRPNQVVIIDQSSGLSSKILVEEYLSNIAAESAKISLTYIHDPDIPGLVAAKARSLQYINSDLVSFLDDDVELPQSYFVNVLRFFNEYPESKGVCGIVLNQSHTGFLSMLCFNLFHFGRFRDERRRASLFKSRTIIKSRNISGGISTYKRSVFENVQFIEAHQLFAYEDIEFSWRVNEYYGFGSTFIDTGIKIVHLCSDVNRADLQTIWERKIFELKTLHRLRKKDVFSDWVFCWLLFGQFIYVVCTSFRNKTIRPFVGAIKGLSKDKGLHRS